MKKFNIENQEQVNPALKMKRMSLVKRLCCIKNILMIRKGIKNAEKRKTCQ